MNGGTPEPELDEGLDGAEDNSRTPTEPPTPTSPMKASDTSIPIVTNGVAGVHNPDEDSSHGIGSEAKTQHARRQSRSQATLSIKSSTRTETVRPSDHDQDQRLEALAKEREALKDEVSQLRQSIEEFQKKHEADINVLQEDLTRTQKERDEKGNQYQSLLGKVNTIRSQLGDRLKADAVSLGSP